jgi:hypothetical protein
MYACGPDWYAGWITPEDMDVLLTSLAGRIVPAPGGAGTASLNHGLHLMGGEPFLKFDLLCRAVETATRLNIPSVFVETNGYWCTHEDRARRKLSLLKELGLKGIMISVNPFYLEYVPFERTELAVRLSRQLFGENTMVYQREYYRLFQRLGIRESIPFEEYLGRVQGREQFLRHVEFFSMGRAPYFMDAMNIPYPTYPPDTLVDLPCVPSFLRPWHNHFDHLGNYVPGYCGGITLGDCRDMDRLLREGIDTRQRPILGFLARGDMRTLLGFARERGYRARARYYGKCHLCVDLRKHLNDYGGFDELSPGEFYRHLETPPRRLREPSSMER